MNDGLSMHPRAEAVFWTMLAVGTAGDFALSTLRTLGSAILPSASQKGWFNHRLMRSVELPLTSALVKAKIALK